MRNAPPVIVRWQQPLSRLWRFGAAALDKAIGSRAYVSVRPPKNEQLNPARDTLFRFDTSSEPPVRSKCRSSAPCVVLAWKS